MFTFEWFSCFVGGNVWEQVNFITHMRSEILRSCSINYWRMTNLNSNYDANDNLELFFCLVTSNNENVNSRSGTIFRHFPIMSERRSSWNTWNWYELSFAFAGLRVDVFGRAVFKKSNPTHDPFTQARKCGMSWFIGAQSSVMFRKRV